MSTSRHSGVPTDTPLHVDVLIVGAGIAGIDAAYHLQTKRPTKSFAILEARESMGGTWDLFRYPGIRSDSDMFTLGFPFRPWTGTSSIADGDSILTYIRETAEAFGIDRHIRYRTSVVNAHWASKDVRWTVDIRDTASGECSQVSCSFLYLCTGYYDYKSGYTPTFAGVERFGGRMVHAQQWTSDVDYSGKHVVVIGSGATAITLTPELAKRAAHVTMLQRSPTYILSVPGHDGMAEWMRNHLPSGSAYAITRWKYVLAASVFYTYCRRFPGLATRVLLGGVRRRLRGSSDVAAHFTPSYKPWDERLCFVPDGDLFEAIRQKRASVVTDHITTFTETGIELRSGTTLECDLVVLATGLKLKWFGGIKLEVDGAEVAPGRTMVFHGMMVSDVPNFAFATGYSNASWTLKCDLTIRYICRLLDHMDLNGFTRCCPRGDPAVEERPLIELASGYVQRAIDETPRQGATSPWRSHENYVLDAMEILYSRYDSELELTS